MNTKEKNRFVKNSIIQLQKLEKQAVSESKRTFRQLKKILKNDITQAQGIKVFLIERLKPLFVKTLFTSYLLGQQRNIICFEKNERESLRLSIIDDMENYLSSMYQTTEGNDLVNINELQELLETRSLRILNEVSDSIEIQLRDKINDMISKGYHVKEAIREIGTTISNLGLDEKQDFQLETIFRTQTQMAYSAGNYQVIQNNEYLRNAIKMFEFCSVMDNRTTEICERLDGTRLPHDDPFWNQYYPPLHYNCRSVCISIFDEENEIPAPKNLEESQLNFNVGQLF